MSPRRDHGRGYVSRARPLLLFALVTLGIVLNPSIARAQQLNLSWVDNSGGQAGFIIQRGPGSSGPYTQIAQVSPGVTSYTDSSVSLGTTYCYQVAAVDASGVSAFSNLACANPSGGFTITAAKAGSGAGTVTSSPSGIACGATCSYTYLAGKAITLTATPSSGSNFNGWSGGGCSGTDPCTVVGNGSVTVTATFAPAAAAVTVSSVAPNQGAQGAAVPVTINGSGFAAGATVSLSGTGVTSSNVAVGSATQLTVTLTIAGGATPGARDVTVANSGGAAATLTGGFSVVAPASGGSGPPNQGPSGAPVPVTLTVAFNGMLRDRVGQGNTALGPDGALDGTLTATLSAPGGRTVTALRLDSDGPGIWDTASATGYFALAVAPTLDGALVNASGTMAVNFPVADGGSFVVFASDYQGIEFLPGRTLTLTATFADGSTATAVTKVTAAGPASGSVTLTLAYNGMLRDRVGQGNTALGADGALDGTLTAILSAPGGRTVTALRLDSDGPGIWDTTSATGYFALAVAPTLDGALVNASGTMAVNFPVADGGSFVVFASDYQGIEFLPGRTLTLTAMFSDGSTATAVTKVPTPAPATLTLAYNGMIRDRVGQGNTALGPDGALDGTLTVTLSAPGGRTVTGVRLDSDGPGIWDTTSATGFFALAVAPTLDGALVNAPGTMAVNFSVADGGSFVVFASDYQGIEFLPGRTLKLTVTFSDGSTTAAVTTVAAAAAPAAATLTLAYNGKLRDRVGQGDTSLGPDGALDGTLTATLRGPGGRTVTALRLDSDAPGTWDTASGTVYWALAVAPTLDGALLNSSATMGVNFPVADGGSFVVFASDYLEREFVRGRRLMLTVTFSDGSTTTAVATVP